MSLSGPRATIETESVNRVLPVGANVKLWQGGLAMLVNGFVVPGAPAVGAVGLGRIEMTADNSGGAAGAINVPVKRGCFKFASAAGDPVLPAQIGASCFIFDDATVAATSGGNTRSVAGIVHQVDLDGVWVRF